MSLKYLIASMLFYYYFYFGIVILSDAFLLVAPMISFRKQHSCPMIGYDEYSSHDDCSSRSSLLRSSPIDDDEIDLSWLNMLDVGGDDDGRHFREARKYTVSDISNNREWLQYIDVDSYEIPPEYIPESVLEDFARPPGKIPGGNSDQNSRDLKEVDITTSSPDDLYRAVFQNENGFNNQSRDFRKSLSGDDESASKAQMLRRGKVRNEAHEKILRDLDDDIAEFSEKLNNDNNNDHMRECKNCGAIKFLPQVEKGEWVCKVCLDSAQFAKHKAEDRKRARILKYSSKFRTNIYSEVSKKQKQGKVYKERFSNTNLATSTNRYAGSSIPSKIGVLKSAQKHSSDARTSAKRKMINRISNKSSQTMKAQQESNVNSPYSPFEGQKAKNEESSEDEVERLKKVIEDLQTKLASASTSIEEGNKEN